MADEKSIYELALGICEPLLRLRALTDQFKIDADDAVVLLLLGSMNVQRKGTLALWAPVTVDDVMVSLTHCPRDRIRQQLRRLTARGLVFSSHDGYVVSDMLTWRRMAEALGEAASADAPGARATSPSFAETPAARPSETPAAIPSEIPAALPFEAILLRLVEAVESIERKMISASPG
jgi:hypothetical protein